MNKFNTLFKKRTTIVGMIHVGALPGTPKFKGSMERIIDNACQEAELYRQCKIDSIIIENMHDVPYVCSKYFGPEIIASMARISTEVKKIIPANMPCGIQILAGGNAEALAVAKVCKLQYVRVESFVFSHIADEGFMDANAGQLLRYRKQIDAEDVLILTDIKKKHCSHAITSDLKTSDVAKAAEFCLSDGLILTGCSTGEPADISEFQSVKKVTNLPIIIGSGVTIDNFMNYTGADALIIGSHFKKDGRWENEISKEKVLKFMESIDKKVKH